VLEEESPALLIFFQQTFRANAFWILSLQLVASWLRQKPQEKSQKQKIFSQLIKRKFRLFFSKLLLNTFELK